MAYTQTRGTYCARAGCHKVLEHSSRGRPQIFCSDRCRKAVARSRITWPENAPKAPTADDPREANSRTKDHSEIKGLQRPKHDLKKSSLSWVRVNEVTWKLTEGKMNRTPASHGKWAGYETERAIAWVSNLGWPFGCNDRYAFCGDKKIGPTDFNSARAAARALANEVQGQQHPNISYVREKEQIQLNETDEDGDARRSATPKIRGSCGEVAGNADRKSNPSEPARG
jgi:hypothetical protein